MHQLVDGIQMFSCAMHRSDAALSFDEPLAGQRGSVVERASATY